MATSVVDDRRAEPGLTLDHPQPRTLGFLDQVALWGNLGISLLGPVTAVFVLAPGMSFAAAFTAVAVGTVIGTAGLALANVAGARTGKPAMVLLRGLFGVRLSYLPTVLNLVQLLGWATFELVVIAAAARQLLPWHMTWPYVVIAGVLSTAMAIRPLGSVRLLRRYALIAVLLSMAYLTFQLLRQPLPSLTAGGFGGFWAGSDLVIAVSVSWIPLAADYSRHSRSPRSAFTGSFVGYGVTQVACYGLGLLAFATVASADPSQTGMFAAFIAVPAGWLAFGILVLRELDESFANVYSTVVSLQNLRPLADRRVLAVLIGGLATLGALVFDISSYQNFLLLLGSVFVPMFAVFAVRYFVLRGWRTWDTSATAPSRVALLLPWVLGFVAYQLVNPGQIPAWVRFWTDVRERVGFTPPSWLSASLTSFFVAGVLTWLISYLPGLRPAPPHAVTVGNVSAVDAAPEPTAVDTAAVEATE
ncbi:MAG TPA: cytosine permease [Micromonosporaceae bacterium]|nr:cytosine permease [Micromonosporaceae bacterium]